LRQVIDALLILEGFVMKRRPSRILRRPRLFVPALAAMGALAAVVAMTAGARPSGITDLSATTGCSVRYSVTSQWATGFTVSITVSNLGSPVTGWKLQYAFPAGQRLTDGWSGRWTQRSTGRVTVKNASWNANLPTGGSASVGANFSDSGAIVAPSAFQLNGTTCTGATTAAPSPTTTSAPPAASPSPTAKSPTPSPTTSTTPPASPAPSPSAPAASAAPPESGSAPQLQVSGNELVDANGQQVVLHGVDRSGTEYACVQGFGIFDGPNDQASVTAMKNVGINAVRVPLNEACWNAESYVNPAYSGAAYQSAIKAYVSLLNANGMVAILDLHWTDGLYTGNSAGCSSAQATCQKPMPDTAQAVPFWTSVAQAFKGNDAVIFDLFNEPYPERADGNDETEGWQCWLDGGTCAGISYQVAGMQTLVNSVRGTGANNVIMLGGLEYANDLTQWLSHEPSDPDHDLAASLHSYNFNACNNQSCWTSQLAPVAAKVPLIAGEIGENDCAASYIDPLMTWLDSQKASYLAWAWNADFNCSGGPGLITDYNGTPTAYGAGYESHLEALAGQ
jgi:endoglucanase